jgi:hypothetical protein
MSPEDVKPEWVEKAARILCEISERDGHTYPGSFGINWDDTDAFWDDAHRVLAAVLPLAQAAAFEDFAARVRARWAKDGERCPWVGALDDEAARLREGSPS